MDFAARQNIDLTVPQFEWRAAIGPLSCLTIIDRLGNNETCSEVRLFGLVRVAGSPKGNPAVLKGQIMRYLAELPWAPDAILTNKMLEWSVGEQTMTVSTDSGTGRFSVTFALDPQGRITSVSAADRPRTEGSHFVERPWQGVFTDYRRHCGRWLPYKAEVGWVLDGRPVTVWQGTIKTWELE